MPQDDKKVETKKPPVTITPADKPVFFWQATEFESHQKPSAWLVYIIGAGLATCGIFLYLRYWLAGAVAIAAVFALWSQSRTRGKKKNYAIYEQGITVDQKVFTFDQFKSFWIFFYQNRPIVRFEQLRRLSLPLEMPIGEENPEQVRLFLSKHLPEEEERGEDITDTINRWIRF